MQRRRSRTPRFPWSPRNARLALLLAWCASLLASVVHVDVAGEAEPECSGHFAATARGPGIVADCPSGESCPDPWHHHHSDARHVDSQCASCSSLLERVLESPVHFEFAPTRVERVAPSAVRVPPVAQRLAVALARGPPSRPSVPMDGTLGA